MWWVLGLWLGAGAAYMVWLLRAIWRAFGSPWRIWADRREQR